MSHHILNNRIKMQCFFKAFSDINKKTSVSVILCRGHLFKLMIAESELKKLVAQRLKLLCANIEGCIKMRCLFRSILNIQRQAFLMIRLSFEEMSSA